MHCNDARQRLDAAPKGATTDSDDELAKHLERCEDCRSYEGELRLTRLLASIPVPTVSDGYADQALARAWKTAHRQPAQQPNRKPYAWVGLAASLVLAVLVTTRYIQPGDSPALPDSGTMVQVMPKVTQPVNVRLVSKEALPDAIITITLDGDVALTGYPGQSTLTWHAPIVAGINQMSLPVIAGGSNSGTIVIEIRSGDATKRMRLNIDTMTTVAAREPGYHTHI